MKNFLVIVVLLFATRVWASGTISGTVRYQGEIPTPQKKPITIDVQQCGKEALSEDLLAGKKGGLQNAVVSIHGAMAGAKPFVEPKEGTVIDQKGCRFVPHVVMVGKGMPLTIFNSDHLRHNVRTYSRANLPVNVVQDPAQPEVTVRFERSEVIEIRCDIHDWMKGWIIVAEHPYSVVTDEEGRYLLRDVPAGDYTLAVWHEKLGFRTKRVQVKEGEKTAVDYRLTDRD